MSVKLETFKEYLDAGTNEGLRYYDNLKSRYQSFKICQEFLNEKPNPSILELGTCRSFVDGKFEGCNSDDIKYWRPQQPEYWDWGAGLFSIVMALSLKKECMAEINSLDISPNHIQRCSKMAESFDFNGKKLFFINEDSVTYLKKTACRYDLIYIDTGDMWPIEPTCQLQLDEVVTITQRNLLKNGGLLLIDDVLNGTPREQGDKKNRYGKSELSIPYLLSGGWEIVFGGYQYILRQKK